MHCCMLALTRDSLHAAPGHCMSLARVLVARSVGNDNNNVLYTNRIGITWGQLPQAGLLVNSVPLMPHTVSTPNVQPVTAPAVGLSLNTPLIQRIPTKELPQSTTTAAIIVSRSLPPVPGKLATKIWQEEYIDLDGLLPTRLGAPEPTLGDLIAGDKQHKEKRGISCIQEWVTCFNTFMAVLALRKPERVVDLLAYSSLIVKASMDFEGNSWFTYDKFFRKQAAAEPARYGTWGEVEPSMWTQHFGRAIAKPMCKECGQSGHQTCQPPRKEQVAEQAKSYTRYKPYTSPKRAPVCERWNRGDRCSTAYCNFQHICSYCSRDHTAQDCPQLTGKRKREA